MSESQQIPVAYTDERGLERLRAGKQEIVGPGGPGATIPLYAHPYPVHDDFPASIACRGAWPDNYADGFNDALALVEQLGFGRKP